MCDHKTGQARIAPRGILDQPGQRQPVRRGDAGAAQRAERYRHQFDRIRHIPQAAEVIQQLLNRMDHAALAVFHPVESVPGVHRKRTAGADHGDAWPHSVACGHGNRVSDGVHDFSGAAT
ncbi:hypothetical protein D3C72_2058810 [compost metagenome]